MIDELLKESLEETAKKEAERKTSTASTAFPVELPQLSPKPQTRRQSSLWIVVVVTALATSVGAYLAYHGVRALMGASAPTFAPSDWQERRLGSLVLEAPLAITSDSKVMAALPPELRAEITKFDVNTGEAAGNTFWVAVAHIQYRPGIEASVDGAVEESIRRAAAEAGVPTPKYSSTPTKINGLEARSVSYQMSASKHTQRMRGIVAVKGPSMWVVQVMYRNEESKSDAERIIDSVRISP